MTTHLLAVHDLSKEAILALFKEAAELKAMRRRVLSAQRLSGKTLGLFFEKPSTRTRVASCAVRISAPNRFAWAVALPARSAPLTPLGKPR